MPESHVNSAGNGLLLRLDRSLTTADVPIGFSVQAFDIDGLPIPVPPLDYSVTPLAMPPPARCPPRRTARSW